MIELTDNYDLYGGTPPHEDVDTSREAAESIRPTVSTLREKVFEQIKKTPNGATCEQIELALGMKHQTVSARIRELELQDRIFYEGKRMNKTGVRARIAHVRVR